MHFDQLFRLVRKFIIITASHYYFPIYYKLLLTKSQSLQRNSFIQFLTEKDYIIGIINFASYLNQRALLIWYNTKRMSNWTKTALDVLKETSRTFYIPIVKLPPLVQQAVASAYLCLRAIDQVQDHPNLSNQTKAQILQNISLSLQKFSPKTKTETLTFIWGQEKERLPEVTLRLAEWVFYCPESFRGRVAQCTASMADRMKYWAQRNWRIENEEDLDIYTMAVAGAVGLILCEIWDWFQSTKTDRSLAIAYGRCLQTVNILRNNDQDSQRGVSFYPPKWTKQDMLNYSKKNLEYANKYVCSLKQGTSAKIFCQIPIALAEATLQILQNGGAKLTRDQVMKICKIAV